LEVEESQRRIEEDYSPPCHSDYEDVFSEAGLGESSSYDDDDMEDTYETTCTGIQNIIFTGEVRHLSSCVASADMEHFVKTDPYHGMAWGRFTFLGRVRPWDGLIALVRLPVRSSPSPAIARGLKMFLFGFSIDCSQADPNQRGRSRWVFRGYLHYGKVLVGSWRGMTMDVDSVPWEGPFVASKRA